MSPLCWRHSIHSLQGVDIAPSHTAPALIAVIDDRRNVQVLSHRIWQPSPSEPWDFAAVEAQVLVLSVAWAVLRCGVPVQHPSVVLLREAP